MEGEGRVARLDPPKGSESVSSKEWSAIARFSLRVESITVKNFSRFTHSRPFQKSTFHTTCSGKRYRSGKLSLARIFRARVEGGGKEEARFQASPLEPFLRDSRAKICTK